MNEVGIPDIFSQGERGWIKNRWDNSLDKLLFLVGEINWTLARGTIEDPENHVVCLIASMQRNPTESLLNK